MLVFCQVMDQNTIESIWRELGSVFDPEIPVLSVLDMGIIRDIRQEGEIIHVTITPTYTGCPAMQLLEMQIKAAVESLGYPAVIEMQIAPAWTTDWMTSEGKRKLFDYGIAPPNRLARLNSEAFEESDRVICPQCKSSHTEKLSEFGSTACKALYRCKDCKEPFDYFKCH